MKKRIFVSMLIIVVVLAASLGATMAWFTDSEELTNQFVAGTLDIEVGDIWSGLIAGEDWENVNPGDCKNKEITITNVGSKNTLVRFRFSGEWQDVTDPDNTLVTATPVLSDEWTAYTVNNETWWYYEGVLPPDTTDDANVLTFDVRVCVDGPGTTNKYQGATFSLSFEFEAIQASNNASGDHWDINSIYDPEDPQSAENWGSWQAPTE